MSELKKCPFCNGEVELHRGYVTYSIICMNCKYEIFNRQKIDETVAKWNNRVSITDEKGECKMTIKELLKTNNEVNEIGLFTQTTIRGVRVTVNIGTLSVIRETNLKYIGIEIKQDIDVSEHDEVLSWSAYSPTTLQIEIPNAQLP